MNQVIGLQKQVSVIHQGFFEKIAIIFPPNNVIEPKIYADKF